MNHLMCFLEMLKTKQLAGMPVTWCMSVQLQHEEKQMGGGVTCTMSVTLALSVLEKVILNLSQPPPVFICYHLDYTNVEL